MIINTYTLLLKVRLGKGKGVNRTWDFFRKRILKIVFVYFPGGTVDKNLPANAGDMVWSLFREDNTCYVTTKPVHHNYWACTLWSACCNYWAPCCNYWSLQALGPMSHNYWACVPKLLKPVHLEPVQFSSVQSLSRVRLFATPWTAAHQASLSPSPTPGVYPNSCPLSRWCHPTISSSVFPFSSCSQSFPTSGSFQIGQFFTSGSQSIGASASASVLPTNI